MDAYAKLGTARCPTSQSPRLEDHAGRRAKDGPKTGRRRVEDGSKIQTGDMSSDLVLGRCFSPGTIVAIWVSACVA